MQPNHYLMLHRRDLGDEAIKLLSAAETMEPGEWAREVRDLLTAFETKYLPKTNPKPDYRTKSKAN